MLTEIPGLRLYRRSAPTACASAAYEPSLVVFVQGKKRINVGKTTYMCDGSNFLLTSVDLPVVSQVIAATEKEADTRPDAQARNAGSARDSLAAGVSSARGVCRRPRHGRRCHFRSNSWMHARGSWTFSMRHRTFHFSAA